MHLSFCSCPSVSVVRLCVCSITWSHCPVWAAILSLSLPLLPALSTAPSIIVLQCHSLKNGEEVEGGRGANERGKETRRVRRQVGCTDCHRRQRHKCVCKGQQCELRKRSPFFISLLLSIKRPSLLAARRGRKTSVVEDRGKNIADSTTTTKLRQAVTNWQLLHFVLTKSIRKSRRRRHWQQQEQIS